MRRCPFVAVFASVSFAGLAGEAPEEKTGQADPFADEQRQAEPSAGEREGLAPRNKEPSAGEREGLAPRKKEPSAGEPAPKDEASKPAERSRVSLEDAKAIVRQAYGGRVVSAAAATARPEPARQKETGYRVRVDVDGRVKTVFVDSRGRTHENAEY